MKTTRARPLRRAALFAVMVVGVAATVLGVGTSGAAASPASRGANPIVRTDDGLVRGTAAGHLCDHPPVDRAHVVEHAAVEGGDEAAADEGASLGPRAGGQTLPGSAIAL